MRNPAVDAYIAKAAEFARPILARPGAAMHQACPQTFDTFPSSKQCNHVEWLTEAKQEATRNKRLATAIEWMAQGKSRPWKYQNC